VGKGRAEKGEGWRSGKVRKERSGEGKE